MFVSSDIDFSFEVFINVIKEAFTDCCPLKRIFTKNALKPWLSPEIKQASLRLKDIYWLHSNIRTVQSLSMYKTAKADYNQLLETSKKQYYANLMNSSFNKNKTTWNLVNKEIGKPIKNQKRMNLLLNGNLCTDPTIIADSFGEYFSTVTNKTISEYFGNTLSTSCTTSKMFNSNFFFFPVTKYEVADAIKMLKNKKSTGIDCISSKTIKVIRDSISEPFAHLVNLSVSTGRFPAILKKSIVIPIHKKGDPLNIANYRPISLLSCFSKVFERIVLDRMLAFLNRFNILTSAQHGFRPGHSTETAAYSFVQTVYEKLDDGLFVAGLFFDLSKAFDSLNFSFMLSKFYSLGFRGIFLDWLESYITERNMSVRIDRADSKVYSLDMGVPQGSVLGPLLFLLFVNDLPDCIIALLVVLFADDSSFLIAGRSFEELSANISAVVKMFVDWCRRNGLIVNLEKTVCIHFGLKNMVANPIVSTQEELSIMSTESTKFLGVQIDRNLRWTEHTDIVCKKLSSAYYALNKIKNLFPLQSLLDMYYCLAYPHMSYNILIWGSASDLGRVFVCQKRVIRCIFRIPPQNSCRPYFKTNKILTVASLYIYKCVLHVKANERSFTKLSSYHRYSTRNGDVLLVPAHRTTKFEHSPVYQSIRIYNHLPTHIKIQNYNRFKNTIKTMLWSRGYYSVSEYLNDSELLSWSCDR